MHQHIKWRKTTEEIISQQVYSSNSKNHILSNIYFFEPLMKYEWAIIWLIGQLLERWIFNYYHFWIVGPLTLHIYYSILFLYFYCYSIFIPSKYAFLFFYSINLYFVFFINLSFDLSTMYLLYYLCTLHEIFLRISNGSSALQDVQ